jgi:hypothetical protein
MMLITSSFSAFSLVDSIEYEQSIIIEEAFMGLDDDGLDIEQNYYEGSTDLPH